MACPFLNLWMMQPTNMAIAVLSVVDMGILVLIPLLDKRLYGSYPKLPTTRGFFNNTGYEGRTHRLCIEQRRVFTDLGGLFRNSSVEQTIRSCKLVRNTKKIRTTTPAC
jgi:hypothetical protein